MFANYHTHTFRCHHALGEDREYVEHAIAHGMKELGFSDHCPWIFDNGYVSAIRMTPDEVEGYFRSLTDLKKEYASDIKIYIGFESEYIPELIEKQDRFLADYPLDYMIMGQHFNDVETCGVYMGVPTADESILVKYVDRIIEGMESGRYLYLAHPDLLCFTGSDEVYNREYTRLCKYMKSKDIPLEINLLGLRDGRHYPCDKFFNIAQKVGNKVIIGCDAHFPQALSDEGPMEKCRNFAEHYGLELIDRLDISRQ